MGQNAAFIAAFLGFVCLGIFIIALAALLGRRFGYVERKTQSRLKSLTPPTRVTLVRTRITRLLSQNPKIHEFLDHYKFIRDLDLQLTRLEVKMNTDKFLILLGISWIATFILLMLTLNSVLAAFLGASVFVSLPLIYLRVLIERRQALLEEQLPNILDFIARGMQAGHTFLSSLQMAASESPEPLASEFGLTFQEISFGKTIQNAMDDLARRVDCEEMRYFAVAVFINHEVGGNLSALLTGVAQLIRERLKLKLSIYALTAEARVSSWILGCLPFVVALLLYIIRPEFISVLWTDPQGRRMMLYTLLLMLIGIYWMTRLSKIRY